MRWQLILKDYCPELIYTKGSTNIVADALSRLETDPTSESIAEAKHFVNIREANAMLCCVEKQIADATTVWRNVLRNVVWKNVKYLYPTLLVQTSP